MKIKGIFNILLGVALTMLLLAGSVEQASAQRSMLSSYGLTSDTVVNTATSYLELQNKGAFSETIVQVVLTEVSGTTAGTLTLQCSLDGTNFKAAVVRDSLVAVPTFTATDVASQNFIWRVTGNPGLYYRVSYTGSGTMSNRFSAKLLSR